MMTNEEAKAVLDRLHFIRRVSAYEITGSHDSVWARAGESVARIRCHLTANQLEAIAVWMRDPEGVANA